MEPLFFAFARFFKVTADGVSDDGAHDCAPSQWVDVDRESFSTRMFASPDARCQELIFYSFHVLVANVQLELQLFDLLGVLGFELFLGFALLSLFNLFLFLLLPGAFFLVFARPTMNKFVLAESDALREFVALDVFCVLGPSWFPNKEPRSSTKESCGDYSPCRCLRWCS